jgi:hypothetical protein
MSQGKIKAGKPRSVDPGRVLVNASHSFLPRILALSKPSSPAGTYSFKSVENDALEVRNHSKQIIAKDIHAWSVLDHCPISLCRSPIGREAFGKSWHESWRHGNGSGCIRP